MNIKGTISPEQNGKIQFGQVPESIVRIYAINICNLNNFYHQTIQEILERFHCGEIDEAEGFRRMKKAISLTKKMMAALLIEQYYNTGDSVIFDKSIMMDEYVILKAWSCIDPNEPDFREFDSGKNDLNNIFPLLIYFRGFFFLIGDEPGGPLPTESMKKIIRNRDEVEKINKKISRARNILQIDEATLGKKYYEGLCMRSHYH